MEPAKLEMLIFSFFLSFLFLEGWLLVSGLDIAVSKDQNFVRGATSGRQKHS